jgi:hypothetical protein
MGGHTDPVTRFGFKRTLDQPVTKSMEQEVVAAYFTKFVQKAWKQ